MAVHRSVQQGASRGQMARETDQEGRLQMEDRGRCNDVCCHAHRPLPKPWQDQARHLSVDGPAGFATECDGRVGCPAGLSLASNQAPGLSADGIVSERQQAVDAVAASPTAGSRTTEQLQSCKRQPPPRQLHACQPGGQLRECQPELCEFQPALGPSVPDAFEPLPE
eukprot:2391639-Rhodomonas_salina.6